MIVREERPEDRQATFELERAAFEGDAEAEIARTVADLEGSFALVAEDDGLIGHVQMSRAWVGETPVVALGPIGVVAERRGEGIGSALILAALGEAARRGERAVILLGDPAFYGRFDFRPAAELGLVNPFPGVGEDGFVIAEEDFMVRLLDDRPLELHGEVRWHPAFGEGNAGG